MRMVGAPVLRVGVKGSKKIRMTSAINSKDDEINIDENEEKNINDVYNECH